MGGARVSDPRRCCGIRQAQSGRRTDRRLAHAVGRIPTERDGDGRDVAGEAGEGGEQARRPLRCALVGVALGGQVAHGVLGMVDGCGLCGAAGSVAALSFGGRHGRGRGRCRCGRSGRGDGDGAEGLVVAGRDRERQEAGDVERVVGEINDAQRLVLGQDLGDRNGAFAGDVGHGQAQHLEVRIGKQRVAQGRHLLGGRVWGRAGREWRGWEGEGEGEGLGPVGGQATSRTAFGWPSEL